MSKKMAGALLLYGVVLAGLGFLVQNRAPALGGITFIVGLIGGGLSLLWGVAALAGLKGRVGATLSTIAVTAALLSQVVHVWTSSASEVAVTPTVRWVVTAMFFLTLAALAYLLHAERPPEFYQTGPTRRGDSPADTPAAAPKARRSQR
jgi:hypothetical protein